MIWLNSIRCETEGRLLLGSRTLQKYRSRSLALSIFPGLIGTIQSLLGTEMVPGAESDWSAFGGPRSGVRVRHRHENFQL